MVCNYRVDMKSRGYMGKSSTKRDPQAAILYWIRQLDNNEELIEKAWKWYAMHEGRCVGESTEDGKTGQEIIERKAAQRKSILKEYEQQVSLHEVATLKGRYWLCY